MAWGPQRAERPSGRPEGERTAEQFGEFCLGLFAFSSPLRGAPELVVHVCSCSPVFDSFVHSQRAVVNSRH